MDDTEKTVREKRDAATKDSHRATASRRPKGLSFQYSSFPVVLSPLPHRDPSTVCASPSFSSLVRPSPRPPAGCLRTAHSLSRHGAVGLGAICTVCLPTTSLLYALSSCLVSHSFLFLVRIFFLPISFFKCYIFSFFFFFPMAGLVETAGHLALPGLSFHNVPVLGTVETFFEMQMQAEWPGSQFAAVST